MMNWQHGALPNDMDWESALASAAEPARSSIPACNSVPALQLSHDELRQVFQYVPDLDRRALQPVCKTWAAVGATCEDLATSATVDAQEYAQRRGRPLDWKAACAWLQQRLRTRPTLSLRLTSGHHTMPAGGLFGVLPPHAATLRTLHLHLRDPGLTSRDIVGLGRLTGLTLLHMDVQTPAEVLAIGLQELQPLSRLTHLSIDAVTPPCAPRKPMWPDDFPTPNYAEQYPAGVLHAAFSLNLSGLQSLESLRFVADARAVHFDTLPPGLLTLSALTSLHLNNCFAEVPAAAFGGLLQLQRLALQDFQFRTPQPPANSATPAPPHPLTKLSGLSSLRQLSLRHCKLDVSGVRLVASLLPQLEELDVGGNRRLELQHEAQFDDVGTLDSWWLRQYLAGRLRKRKSGEMSCSTSGDNGSGLPMAMGSVDGGNAMDYLQGAKTLDLPGVS